MDSQARIYAGSAVYGLLVFGGTALLGFVVAPSLGSASRLFPIEADARAFFSLLTLEGAPYLAALGALSGPLFQTLSRRRLRARVMLFGLNVLVAWLIGASIALSTLG